MSVKNLMERLYKDLITKEFIPIKILSVMLLGGATSLFPFLTIQARSLGIADEELGIIYSIIPLFGIFVPTISGMLADKIGNFKNYLSLMVTLSGIASLCLLLVPQGRIRHQLPENLPMILNCTSEGNNIDFIYPYTCNYKENITSVMITISNCTRKCPLVNISENPNYRSNCNEIKDIELLDVLVISDLNLENNEENQTIMTSMTIIPENEHKKYAPNLNCSQNDVVCENCWTECESMVERNSLCSNEVYTEDINPTKTLAFYAMALLLLIILSTSIMPLFGGATIAIVKEKKGDYGFQNVYLNIGMIIFTPISGKLIDVFSKDKYTVNFGPPVYIYLGMNILCSIIIYFIDLEFKKPSKQVFKNLKCLLVGIDIIAFLFISFVGGACFGFLETFLFWLLDDMGAKKEFMAYTITLGASAGIPMLILATPIIKKLGHANTISFSMAVFVFRFLGFSFITEPWMALPLEFLECFTLALLGVTSTSYTAELTNPSNVVTLQGISSAVHWGIGKGCGSLLGGVLSKKFGLQVGFRIMSLICGVASLLYFLSSRFCFKENKEAANDVSITK